MLESVIIDGREYTLADATPIDISIPLHFNGPQPNAYGVDAATATPSAAGDLVGDTRKGGSCNFEQYTLIPHCNGTHTECVGHITHERISIRSCLQDVFTPVRVITIAPSYAADTGDTYSMAIDPSDRLITRKLLESAMGGPSFNGVLTPSHSIVPVIRTLPNDDRKLRRTYLDVVPPYLTTEAIEYIFERGFKHLLVDLPSIDRLYDEGRLSNHRIFWGVDQGSFSTKNDSRVGSTITEMIYVPNEVEDGPYLLNLQIAPFASDASPSRPLLFRITQN